MPSTLAATFDIQTFLERADIATKVVVYRRHESIFSQGEAAKSVLFIRKGGVKLSVRSQRGREVVVAMLGPGDLFGEGCLAGQPVRMGHATAATPSVVLAIGKAKMEKLLHEQQDLADWFIVRILEANVRLEEDLTNECFNHAERRLARTLLVLARYGEQDEPQHVLPRVPTATLAKLAGTSRAKVTFFMKRFNRLGFIDQKEGLTIHDSLLSVVLHD